MVLQLFQTVEWLELSLKMKQPEIQNESLSQSSIETKIFTLKNRAAGEILSQIKTYHWKAISSVKHPID